MKKRILSIMLAAVLMLTACTPKANNKETSKPKGTAAPTSTAALESTDEQLLLPTATSDIGHSVPTTTGSENDISATENQNSADETPNRNETAVIPTGTNTKPQTTANANTTPAATAKPNGTAAPIATSKPDVTAKPQATPTPTKKPTATATAIAKPTATTKPTVTSKPTPTPTQKPITYSFYPSSVTVYSGDQTDVYIKIKDSNGRNVPVSELDLSWYDLGNGDFNYNRNTSQKNGTYSVSDANVSRLSAMIYADGTDKISVSGYWGKIGTCTIKVKHKSGQMLTLTVKSIKDPKYAAYYHPYNWAVIDADMKAFVESKNGVYDTSLTPENSGYLPGAELGGYTTQGKTFYDFCLKKLTSPVENIIAAGEPNMTVDDWNGIRLYLWRKHTSGTIGADDEYYLFRALYG